MKSRTEIKREVVQAGGTIDEAFKLINVREAARKQIEDLIENDPNTLLDLLTIEQVQILAQRLAAR